MLRALMAVSADGFVCRDAKDDMRWTGSEDKRLFRETTMGGVLGCGSTTHELMPPLKGRRLIRITREAPLMEGLPLLALCARAMTLGDFAREFPDGWLIGGQTVLQVAIRMALVDRVLMSHVRAELGSGVEDRTSRLLYDAGWRGRSFPQDGLTLVTWTKQ